MKVCEPNFKFIYNNNHKSTPQASRQKKPDEDNNVQVMEVYRNRKYKKKTLKKHIFRRTYIHKKHTQNNNKEL